MLCHYMLFHGAYVGKVVGKVMRECGCCMANIGIRDYVTATNDLTRPSKMTSKAVENTWANIGFFLHQLDPEVRRLVRRVECLPLKI